MANLDTYKEQLLFQYIWPILRIVSTLPLCSTDICLLRTIVLWRPSILLHQFKPSQSYLEVIMNYYFRDLAFDLAKKFDSSKIVLGDAAGHNLPLESDPAFTQTLDFTSINEPTYSALSQNNLTQAIAVVYIDNGGLRHLFSDESVFFVTSALNKTNFWMTDGRLASLSQDLSFTHVEFDNHNYDDGINISDVVGLSTSSGTQKIATDIDGNRAIEIDDIIFALRHFVKLDTLEQCASIESSDQIVTSLRSSIIADLTILRYGDVDLSATFII